MWESRHPIHARTLSHSSIEFSPKLSVPPPFSSINCIYLCRPRSAYSYTHVRYYLVSCTLISNRRSSIGLVDLIRSRRGQRAKGEKGSLLACQPSFISSISTSSRSSGLHQPRTQYTWRSVTGPQLTGRTDQSGLSRWTILLSAVGSSSRRC